MPGDLSRTRPPRAQGAGKLKVMTGVGNKDILGRGGSLALYSSTNHTFFHGQYYQVNLG